MSYYGPAPQAPVTRAGSSVRQALEEADWAQAFRRLTTAALDIVDQILAIGFRRRLVLEPDTAIERYVAAGSGAKTTDDIADAAAIVRIALGRRKQDVSIDPKRRGQIILLLLRRLREDGCLKGSELLPLLVTAECRTARRFKQLITQQSKFVLVTNPGWRSRVAFLKEYQAHFQRMGGEAMPSSVIGQMLRAIARFDFEKRDRLPDAGDDRGFVAVVNGAFAAVLPKRFSHEPDDAAIASFVQMVSANAVRPLTPDAVEEVVRDGLQSTLNIDDVPTEEVAKIRILTFAHAVDDVGMYDYELDELLQQAEQAAESIGQRPVSMHDASRQ